MKGNRKDKSKLYTTAAYSCKPIAQTNDFQQIPRNHQPFPMKSFILKSISIDKYLDSTKNNMSHDKLPKHHLNA